MNSSKLLCWLLQWKSSFNFNLSFLFREKWVESVLGMFYKVGNVDYAVMEYNKAVPYFYCSCSEI